MRALRALHAVRFGQLPDCAAPMYFGYSNLNRGERAMTAKGMKIEDLKSLLVHELKDIYSAEKQLVKALPKMARAANYIELKGAFEQHLVETEEHVRRIERIFESLEFSPSGVKCAAMEGLVKESEEMIAQDAPDDVKDAGLICCAQRIEHYEMAAYGCARAFATQLGYSDAVEILSATLDEERNTDRMLTDIAESVVNAAAVDG